MFRRAPLLLITLSLVGLGCTQRQDLAGDTVRVTWSDRTIDLEVIACGLDGDVFVLGATSADSFVQMLLTTDDDAVDLERSAVSVEVDPGGVLGAGSATLLGVGPVVPGEITRARIRGDRIDVVADARVLDGSGSEMVEIEVSARCPAVEDFV